MSYIPTFNKIINNSNIEYVNEAPIFRAQNAVIDQLQVSNIVIGGTGAIGFGSTGPQGPMGSAGLIGQTGPQGLIGEIGLIGPTGAIGPQGSVGVTGKGFVIFSSVSSFSQLCSTNPTGSNIGEFVLITGGDLYVYAGSGLGTTGPAVVH